MNGKSERGSATAAMTFDCMCRVSIDQRALGITLYYLSRDGGSFGPEIIALAGTVKSPASVYPKGMLSCMVPPQALSGMAVTMTLQGYGPPSESVSTLSLRAVETGQLIAIGDLYGTGLGSGLAVGAGTFGQAKPFMLAMAPEKYVMTIGGSVNEAGSPILLGERNWSDAQAWRFRPAKAPGFYWLENYVSGLVAGPSKATAGAGTPLELQAQTGDDAQLWSLAYAAVDPHRVVLSSKADASQVVTLSGGSMEDGAPIVQAAADGQFTQAWLILGSRAWGES